MDTSCPLSCHFAGTGVSTYSLHPGIIRTELARHFLATMPLWKRVVFTPLKFLIKSPTEGAQTTIYCAVEESLQNESGLYYRSVIVNQLLVASLLNLRQPLSTQHISIDWGLRAIPWHQYGFIFYLNRGRLNLHRSCNVPLKNQGNMSICSLS